MLTVNQSMFESFLDAIGGTADFDDDRTEMLSKIDGNNEKVVKSIILSEIKPYYESRNDAYKASAKRSLSYFLTTNTINFGRIYDSCLIAFDHPTDPKLFFLWVWEILFPNESYVIEDIEQYIEIDDINEPNSYW